MTVANRAIPLARFATVPLPSTPLVSKQQHAGIGQQPLPASVVAQPLLLITRAARSPRPALSCGGTVPPLAARNAQHGVPATEWIRHLLTGLRVVAPLAIHHEAILVFAGRQSH